MPRPQRNALTLNLTGGTSGPNLTDDRLAQPQQTPFMENTNKENMPPPPPRARRVIPIQPPPLRAIGPTRPSGPAAAHRRPVSQIGMPSPFLGPGDVMSTFVKPASRPELWTLQRPATPPMHINAATGLWGTDINRVFVAPKIWEHPSSECLLFTAEQDEELRHGGAPVAAAKELEIDDPRMERVHRNLLFSRFGRRG